MTVTNLNQSQKNQAKPKWWQTLLKGNYLTITPRRGAILEVTILAIDENGMFVNIDGKRDGIIQRRDLENVDEAYLSNLKVGDRIPVRVLKVPYNQSVIPVSLKQGLQQNDWLRAKSLKENQEVVDMEVIDYNRGGVLVRFGGLRGFIPNSHIASIPRGVRGLRRTEAKAALIGQTLSTVVIEAQPNQRRLVLSERMARKQQRAALLAELHEGAILTGVVSNLTRYGAFVDLGGFDGLVHISELTWDFIDHPKDVVKVGEKIEVYVLDVDRKRERISLSRKRLLDSPWETVTANMQCGDSIQGTVSNITNFGTFVDLGSGVEGLIPGSGEFGSLAGSADLSPGMRVQVRIMDIDSRQQRITLRLQNIVENNENDEVIE